MTEQEAKVILEAELQHHPETSIFGEAIGLAIQALEKQIPKRPIEYEDKYYGCPNCGDPLMHKWKKYNTELMEKSNSLPVCINCLQAIDWGDEV